MSDLKQENCPFCGSKNISAGEVSTDYAGGHGAQCTQSRCDDCGALGPEADLADGEVDYGDVKAITAWNRRTQPEATAPAQDLSAAIRLRLVCKLLGLGDAVPKDDAELWGCAFSVLGMIRAKLEEKKPIGYVVQHDASGGNFFAGTSSFDGMRKTYGRAAKLVYGVPVNNLSDAILALPCKAEGSTLPLQQHYASGFMAALESAAALASSANALSEGNRVDAVKEVLKELLAVMPVLPKSASNIVGMKEKYGLAVSNARAILAAPTIQQPQDALKLGVMGLPVGVEAAVAVRATRK